MSSFDYDAHFNNPASLQHRVVHGPPTDGSTTPPFLLHLQEEPVKLFRQSPGTRVHVKRDVEKLTRMGKRHLAIRVDHQQWKTPEELINGTSAASLLMVILNDSACRELPGSGLTSDMRTWEALMKVHPIPCTLVASIDTTGKEYISNIYTIIEALSCRWHVRKYLETSRWPLPLTLREAAGIVPLLPPTEEKEEDVICIGGALPVACTKDRSWRFYALSSEPASLRSAALLKKALVQETCKAVILAMKVRIPPKDMRRKRIKK